MSDSDLIVSSLICFFILIVIIAGVTPKKESNMVNNYGTNLRSVGWRYTQSTDSLSYDLGRLEAQNIRLLCVQLHWYLIEPSVAGTYSDTFLDRIRTVIQIADTYGMEVVVDFHSGAGLDKTYGLPTWVTGAGKDFDDVATNATYKGYYTDMLDYVIGYLDDLDNIHSYQIFNEPNTIAEHASYLTLFQDAYAVADAATTRDISMRIGPYMLFGDNWNSSSTFMNLWDYGPALNIYLDAYAYHTEPYLNSYVALCSTYSKKPFISEYGWNSEYDATQTNNVKNQIEKFLNLGIEETLLEIFGPTDASNYFNVRRDDGTIRPALYELWTANEEASTPSEPPIEPPPAQYYTVNVSAGTGGQVSPSGTFDRLVNQSISVSAQPDPNYKMGAWTLDGLQVTTNPNYEFTGDTADRVYNLVASFTADAPVEPDDPSVPGAGQFTVNIQAQTGGTVSPSGEQTYSDGETITATATPKTNNRFNYWLFDNVATQHGDTTFSYVGSAGNQYTLLAVFQQVTVPSGSFLPASGNVALLSSGAEIAQIIKRLQDVEQISAENIMSKFRGFKF